MLNPTRVLAYLSKIEGVMALEGKNPPPHPLPVTESQLAPRGEKKTPVLTLGYILARKYINNSLHLARKCPRTFSVPSIRSRKTVSYEEQIMSKDKYPSIFAPNGGYCLQYPSNILRNARSFENWGISSDIPQF